MPNILDVKCNEINLTLVVQILSYLPSHLLYISDYYYCCPLKSYIAYISKCSQSSQIFHALVLQLRSKFQAFKYR